MAQGSPAE
jgi:hypothetical protein